MTEQKNISLIDEHIAPCPKLLEADTDPRVFLGEQIRHAILNATLSFDAPDSILSSQNLKNSV